ncbi:hypothetical protein Lal_00042249, partial [Lupinus albus]
MSICEMRVVSGLGTYFGIPLMNGKRKLIGICIRGRKIFLIKHVGFVLLNMLLLLNFLWDGDANKRSLNLVKWEIITMNTKYGGLGIRDTHLANISLLGKLSWNMIQWSNKLWCKVLKQRYLRVCCMIFRTSKPSASPVWKSIVKEAILTLLTLESRR